MSDLVEYQVDAASRVAGVVLAKAWARSTGAEIVAQQRLPGDSEFIGRYILVHRRSGLGMRTWSVSFDDLQEATAAAERVEAAIDWSQIRADEYDKMARPSGWGSEQQATVGAVLDQIAAELDAKRAEHSEAMSVR